jgi:hypothetical protein
VASFRVKFDHFTFPELTRPKGFLSPDKRAQACWYFYTLAEKLRQMLGDSTDDQFGLLEGSLWMDPHYVNIAKSVALIYGLESPDEFAKAWDEVRDQAAALGLPAPHPKYTRLAPGLIGIN